MRQVLRQIDEPDSKPTRQITNMSPQASLQAANQILDYRPAMTYHEYLQVNGRATIQCDVLHEVSRLRLHG